MRSLPVFWWCDLCYSGDAEAGGTPTKQARLQFHPQTPDLDQGALIINTAAEATHPVNSLLLETLSLSLSLSLARSLSRSRSLSLTLSLFVPPCRTTDNVDFW